MVKTPGFRPGFCTHSVIANDTTLFKHKVFPDKNLNLNGAAITDCLYYPHLLHLQPLIQAIQSERYYLKSFKLQRAKCIEIA